MADAAQRQRIVEACAGADGRLGTDDDLDPQDDLGFSDTCAGDAPCNFAIDTLATFAECGTRLAGQMVGEALGDLARLPLPADEGCKLLFGRNIMAFADLSLRERSSPRACPCHGRPEGPRA